jgi:hypothetical protein
MASDPWRAVFNVQQDHQHNADTHTLSTLFLCNKSTRAWPSLPFLFVLIFTSCVGNNATSIKQTPTPFPRCFRVTNQRVLGLPCPSFCTHFYRLGGQLRHQHKADIHSLLALFRVTN